LQTAGVSLSHRGYCEYNDGIRVSAAILGVRDSLATNICEVPILVSLGVPDVSGNGWVMSRKLKPAWILFLLLVAVPMTSVHAQPPDVIHPSIFGYAYQLHSAGPDLWTVGNIFTIVTIAQPGDLAIIPLDDTLNEYTVVLEDLRVARYTESGGTGFVEFETGMIFSAYEDPRATGTSADFGSTPPPNGVSPSSFIDGTQLALSGTASDSFVLRFDLANGIGFFLWRSGLPIMNCALLGPGFEGFFRILGEVALPNANVNPPVEMPAPGYVFRLMAVSDCDSPLQPSYSSWGRLKSLYR
jgi:hypothetical protein